MIEHSAGYRVEKFNIYTDFGQVPTNVAKPVSITISPFSPEVSNRRNKFGYRSGQELFTASSFDVSQCNVESFEPKMRQVAKFSCFAETLASLYSLYSNGDDCSTRYDKINQVILASQKDLNPCEGIADSAKNGHFESQFSLLRRNIFLFFQEISSYLIDN